MDIAFRHNYPKLLLVMIISLLISLSWLIFPYLVQGDKLLRGAGDDSRLMQGAAVSRFYTRVLANSPDLELTATFATDEFFQFVDNTGIVGNVRPDKNFIFFVGENIHQGALSSQLPEAALIVGQQRYLPQRASGPRYADHHRVTLFSFPKRDKNGEIIDLDTVESIQLEVAGYYLGNSEQIRFMGIWLTPFELPDELKSRAAITWIGVLALGTGLLSSVLTPCLLQLVVMFGVAIGGFSTVPYLSASKFIDKENGMAPLVRRKIMRIALAFVAGFTLLYMLAGALIGAVGHQAQLVFAEFSRPISVVSGIVVILLGLWLGLRGTRPFSCKLPSAKTLEVLSTRDTVATVVTSLGYALGCTACFGGAIVATLIIYVGAIGSAAIGAGIMLVFSIGVAVPFLLAAYYLSRIDSLLLFLAEKSRAISFVGMLLVVAMGLILVTDNFHVISDSIYPYLGLGGR